jgi:para-aminobenzoate synthetase component 1
MVETRPIKGTRPRGATAAEDRRLREELLASAKDRAELIMIVDLERNDIGRVCRYGTIQPEELVRLETHPVVHHLVSTIKGELADGCDHIDCLRACFPGGSITGAPKIRAMEIIEELEPCRRKIYTGSMGYLGFNGETDLNILIRTMLHINGTYYFNVGGGIVADSDPEMEYDETLHKGRGIMQALGMME